MKTHTPVIVSNRDWQDLIGIQFALGGSDPQTGLNCYGLVREIYRGLQIELPEHQETALDADLAVEAAGNDWTLLEQPQPYAVALIRSEGTASMFHLAIVTPELTLLHALPKKGVVVSDVSAYADRIIGIYRYTPGEGQRLPLADGDVGRIIGAVLLAAATIYTGGAVGAALGGGFWGTLGGAAAAMAVSVAGNMILNAIAPIKPEGNQLSGYTGDLADSRSYTWDGIQNESRQGLPKAMIFGRVKVGGQIISEKTWFDGSNNEYLDMLLCPAVGRVTRFAGIQINDTDISLYKNTGPVFRPGDDQQTPIDMFNRIYLQFSSAAKIPYDASTTAPTQSVQFTTKGAVGGIRLTVSAPNGIFEMASTTPVPHDVVFRVQYQADGDTAWTALPAIDPDYAAYHPFIYRTAGVFTGAANPYTLTDAAAGFVDKLSTGAEFELVVGAATYFCTQSGVLTAGAVAFNAWTDAGKTTPLGTKPADGAYEISDNTVKRYSGTAKWDYIDYDTNGGAVEVTASVTPPLAIETEVAVKALSCRVVVESTEVSWARLIVRFQKTTDSEWTTVETFDVGYPDQVVYDRYNDTYTTIPAPPIGSAFRDVSLPGLVAGSYRLAVLVDNQAGGPLAANNFRFDNIALDTSSTDGLFTISGDPRNPMHLVTKQIELLGLPETVYNFRVWRTTTDQTGTTWQDDVYLRGYAEIVDRKLSYPNHALIGIRAMGTDRLYGGRPRITSIATGAPLTVPAAALRYDTTCTNGIGTVTTYRLVAGTIVTGMNAVIIPVELPAPDGSYFWLVRMDSSGYAQPDRLLTKHFLRVHTWEVASGHSIIYLQDVEDIPNNTPLMLFSENADPYISRHTAWATAKMLIDGSHGRITAAGIDWDAFAAWDAWNMEIKAATGQPRHLFDAVVDFNTDLWSLAMKTAQTARGNLMKKGNRYSVWIDKAATHQQLFGEGNSKNVTVSPIPRADRANILTTSFLDQTANFDQKDISIEDVQGNEYPIVKNIPVQVGVTRETQVTELLQYMLLQNRYVGSAITLEAGIDSLEVVVGGVFMVASQAKDFSLSGRLVNTYSNLSYVELDQPFTPEVGVTYQLTVWGTDGTLYIWSGTLSGTDITTITKPVGLPESGHYEYPYVLAKLTEERMKYRCIGIRREADTMHATLSGIEYRDEVYAND